MKSTIFSIGHGHKSEEEFSLELSSFDIKYLIDVRSSPYSKWAPHFNTGAIQVLLNRLRIKYIYMGDVIGGRPTDDSYYDNNGYYDYRLMAENPDFKAGLNRIVLANSRQCRVAVMCSESDPTECHRSKLIGRELFFGHSIVMNHIIDSEKVVSQIEIMIALTNGHWTPEGNLFGECPPPFFKSRKPYKTTEQPSYMPQLTNLYD